MPTILQICLAEGVGVERDDKSAVVWLRRAAEGVVNAQYWYGRMLAEGRGVAKDDTEAAVWFTRAAEAGSCGCPSRIGRISCGWPRRGARSSIGEVLVSPRRRCRTRRCDVRAGRSLMAAAMISKRMRETARTWFTRGAELGHPIAALMLARYSVRGLGGSRDVETGRRWYAYAADHGAVDAAEELAELDLVLTAPDTE